MPKKVSLNAKCPHCDKSLMDPDILLFEKPSMKLNIETTGERGTIRLCSIYGCYGHVSDIDIKDKEIARFFCPHCNKELISNDQCNSPNWNAPMIPEKDAKTISWLSRTWQQKSGNFTMNMDSESCLAMR